MIMNNQHTRTRAMGEAHHLPSSLVVKLCRVQGSPDMGQPNQTFIARAMDALERTMEAGQSHRRWLNRAKGIIRKNGWWCKDYPDGPS